MPELNGVVNKKYRALQDILRDMGRVVVAMSGGVDSVLLARVASDVLGERALAVTADSPSLPRRELRETVALAQRFGIQHRVIQTDEVTDPRYAANPLNRCYFCKDELFGRLDEIARDFQAQWVCFGENVDDQSDYRPGSLAAGEHGVRAPLREANLGKSEIRQLAQRLGLPIWEKPASACLASRFPYGTAITPEKLAQVEAAEDFLAGLGFHQYRVRHHGQIARIEVDPAEMHRLVELGGQIHQRLHEIGFAFVAMDLAGYRRGSLNETAQILDPQEISLRE